MTDQTELRKAEEEKSSAGLSMIAWGALSAMAAFVVVAGFVILWPGLQNSLAVILIFALQLLALFGIIAYSICEYLDNQKVYLASREKIRQLERG